MKRVAAGAHLPTTWLFKPAKRPDDKADYCLDNGCGGCKLRSLNVLKWYQKFARTYKARRNEYFISPAVRIVPCI